MNEIHYEPEEDTIPGEFIEVSNSADLLEFLKGTRDSVGGESSVYDFSRFWMKGE